jgi:hypothetical protein
MVVASRWSLAFALIGLFANACGGASDAKDFDAAASDAAADDAGGDDAGTAALGEACGDTDGGVVSCVDGLACCQPCGDGDCQYTCAEPCDRGSPGCTGGCELLP